jgi:NAD-dependent protein deacetylases, SIR2 family
MNSEIEQLQEMVDKSSRIVFFGGAGVSTESGIPDFRSVDGLYHQHYKYPPEVMLSHSFYESHTTEFFDFYRAKMLCPDAKPNAAHIKLAEMEKAGKLTAVVTQNIDGLHQMAGSKNVFELHGSVHRNYCLRCRKLYDAEFMLHSEGVPACECGGTIKPDVVLYEEGLNTRTINGAVRAIEQADMLIIGGTSLVVYPAASLVNYFGGSRLVLINKSATSQDSNANLVIEENIGEVLSRIQVK